MNFPSLINNSPSIKTKFLKKLYLSPSSNKGNQYIYSPKASKTILKPKIFTPINNHNNRSVEKYLLLTSLMTKKNDSISFNINYFKKLSHHNSPIFSQKNSFSSVLTNNAKETFKENFIISMLNKKKEEISKNEKELQNYFKERKKKLNDNLLNFSIIINEYKEKKNDLEQILNNYKLMNQKIKKKILNRENYNKKLKDTIEKTIRDIYKLKEYANFIHKVYNIPFVMEKIDNKLLEGNKFDILIEKIINLYNKDELKNEDIKQKKILRDIPMFIQNFELYEDKIIQLLKEEETILNNINLKKNENKRRLRHLIIRKNY